MKNKGFTLIEIIAVIIIIGILMIITIPNISGFLSDSRVSAYKSHEKTMEEAARSYTIECIKNNEQGCYLPREGEEINILLGELEEKEFLEKLQDPSNQGAYCNPEESYVKIGKSYEVDYDYTVCLYCGTYSTENSGCSKIDVNPTTIQCGTDIRGTSDTWTKDARTISINCVDTDGSCKQERFEKSFGTTMEYGDITIYDKNPARGTKPCRVPVRIDLEKPTCSLDVSGDNRGNYYVGDVTVTMPFSSRKDNHSGVGAYGLGTSNDNKNYDNKENIIISNNGITRVFGYIKDKVGNENICTTNVSKVGKYYIIYDKNTGNGTMADTECIFGENCTLRTLAFTKLGFHFNYWSTLANGNTAKHYRDEEVVKNLTFSDTIRLYAIWEKNQNTLTVDANTGTGGFTEKHEYEYEKAINVAKTGYSFTGWDATGTCGTYTNEASTTYTYPANRDTTCKLTAGWSINSNTLVVDANGGTGSISATAQNYNTTKNISVSRTGYTFTGWTASGTCGDYTNTASTTYTYPPNKDTTCTLTANWQINKNTLEVKANGGTGGFTTEQDYNTTKTISVSRTNYTFTGWTESGTCGSYTNSASTTYTYPANSGTTCTLTANWKAKCSISVGKKYTASFKSVCTGKYKVTLCGGSGGIDDYNIKSKGACITGYINLEYGDNVTIVKGGEGSSTAGEGWKSGGANGGGDAYWSGGGGGRTDLSVNNTLIVAAAGGGGGTNRNPEWGSGCVGHTYCDGGNGRKSTSTGNTNNKDSVGSRWKGTSGRLYTNNGCKQDAGGGGAGWTEKGGANGVNESCTGRHGGYGGISGYDNTKFTLISEGTNNSSNTGTASVELNTIS